MLLAPVQNDYAFIACREAFVATTYMDAHNPANGFGQNDSDLQPGQVTTMEAAIARFKAFCTYLDGEIDKVFPNVSFNQHESGAVRSLTYNIGPHGAYKDRPGGGLAFQAHLIKTIGAYKADDGKDSAVTAFLRDMVGKEITWVNEDPITGRPFNASRRWREAILFVAGDYGNVSKLISWGPNKDPKKDASELIDMPQFV